MTSRINQAGNSHSENSISNFKSAKVNIQQLQKMIIAGSILKDEERAYLETQAQHGVKSYLRRRFKKEDVDSYIIAYGTRSLSLPEKELNTATICFKIQFAFGVFKSWINHNYPNKH